MTTRYFKATDGKVTVFRASKTRVYSSAWFDVYAADDGGPRVGASGFSVKPAGWGGQFPAVEISKAEYDALVVRKVERIKAAGGNPSYAAPHSSWVRNETAPRPRRRSLYHDVIEAALKSLGATADPRHIEGHLRLQYGTLDHLDRATFRRETKVALGCIAEGGVEAAEELAKSYGL
jgi:hypothetical protein